MFTRLFIFSGFLFYSLTSLGQASTFQAHLLNYDVKYYWLNLELENTSVNIKGYSTIGAQVTAQSLDTFAFQLHDNYKIDSIVVNGIRYTSSVRAKGQVRMKLDAPAAKGIMLHAAVYYSGTAPKTVNTWQVGLVNAKDALQNGITYSLSVPYSAYEWFPCKQVMADLADSVYLDITVDSGLSVAGNGLLQGIINLGNGKQTWRWRSRYAINYYLIAVSVGKYAEIKGRVLLPGETDSMLIHNMVYDDSATISGATELLTTTAGDFLKHYSDLFGTYPFAKEKFGIYTIPLSGGMEHQTMPALGEIEFYLLAHEMAHQWFGDHVNLGTFRDMWLNEGWARYCEYLIAEKFRPAQAPALMGNWHYDVLFSPKSKGYVSDTIVFNNLYHSRNVYNKGGAVFHTLRKVIDNDSVFFDAVTEYQERFGLGHARMQDFIDVMEEKSGLDLTQFFQQWYYGEGYPTFTVTWYQKDRKVKIKLVQTTSSPSVTPLFVTPVEIRLTTATGEGRVRLEQVIGTQYYEIPFVETVTALSVDPDNWLLNKVKSVTQDSSILSVPVPENKDEGMRVYPNPFAESLCVELQQSSSDTYVRLSSVTGHIVTSSNPSKKHFSLDTAGLAGGIYILSVRQNDVWQFERVVKME